MTDVIEAQREANAQIAPPMTDVIEAQREANAQIALAVIATASPERLGQLLAAAIDRAADIGRDAWLATSAAFDGDHDQLEEALQWLGQIAAGEPF